MPFNASGDAYRAKAILYRELAERTSDPALRRIHEKMATLYDRLAEPGAPAKGGRDPPDH